MNVILATGNRKVDRCVLPMKEVTVLTTVTRREQVIDRALALNPHVLILGDALTGHVDWRDLIGRLRALKPLIRIVFILGRDDGDQRLFMDFLIRNGVYDVIVGSVNEFNVKTALLEPTTFDEMKSYLLEDLPIAPEQSFEPVSPAATKQPESIPRREVVLVEKIIEREMIRQEYIGCITIGVVGILPRSGVTHTALMIGSALSRNKKDVGVVVSDTLLTQLREYYEITSPATVIDGVKIYDDYAQAASIHHMVVVDEGHPDEWGSYFTRTVKVMLCPSMPWEIDALTVFLREHETMAPHLQYLFYPVSGKRFDDLRRNMKQGSCRAWALAYSPEWSASINDKTLLEILKPYLKEGKKHEK